jgi:hypothetical protein
MYIINDIYKTKSTISFIHLYNMVDYYGQGCALKIVREKACLIFWDGGK